MGNWKPNRWLGFGLHRYINHISRGGRIDNDSFGNCGTTGPGGNPIAEVFDPHRGRKPGRDHGCWCAPWNLGFEEKGRDLFHDLTKIRSQNFRPPSMTLTPRDNKFIVSGTDDWDYDQINWHETAKNEMKRQKLGQWSYADVTRPFADDLRFWELAFVLDPRLLLLTSSRFLPHFSLNVTSGITRLNPWL